MSCLRTTQLCCQVFGKNKIKDVDAGGEGCLKSFFFFFLSHVPCPVRRAWFSLSTISSLKSRPLYPSWPQTHYIAEDDFELLILSLPPECWDCRFVPGLCRAMD